MGPNWGLIKVNLAGSRMKVWETWCPTISNLILSQCGQTPVVRRQASGLQRTRFITDTYRCLDQRGTLGKTGIIRMLSGGGNKRFMALCEMIYGTRCIRRGKKSDSIQRHEWKMGNQCERDNSRTNERQMRTGPFRKTYISDWSLARGKIKNMWYLRKGNISKTKSGREIMKKFSDFSYQLIISKLKLTLVAWVRERTIPTERPPLVSEVIANFEDRGCHVVSVKNPYGRILGFLDRSRYFSIK
jgi:hypothetical protein